MLACAQGYLTTTHTGRQANNNTLKGRQAKRQTLRTPHTSITRHGHIHNIFAPPSSMHARARKYAVCVCVCVCVCACVCVLG